MMGVFIFFFLGVVCMKRRKSYFANFSTNSLFALMEQSKKELDDLEIKLLLSHNQLLIERAKQLQLLLDVSKNVIIKRYLEENISLSEVAKLLTTSEGVRKDVYKDLFTLKILDTNEIISLDLLKSAVDLLELSDLMTIIRTKKDTIYQKLAMKKYDKMIFDVEPEVYQEYLMKKKLDRKKER